MQAPSTCWKSDCGTTRMPNSLQRLRMNATFLIFPFIPLRKPECFWYWGTSLVVNTWIRVSLWTQQQRTSGRNIPLLLFVQKNGCLPINPLSSPSTQSKLGLSSSDNSVPHLKKKQSQPVTQSLAGQFYTVSNCWGMGNVEYIYPFKHSFRKDTGCRPVSTVPMKNCWILSYLKGVCLPREHDSNWIVNWDSRTDWK